MHLDDGKSVHLQSPALRCPKFSSLYGCGDWMQIVEEFLMDAFHPSIKRNGSNGAPAVETSNPGASRAHRAKSVQGYEYVRERRVLKVLKMVQAQPLLRIRDVAHEVHLSKSRLEHMFKQETGVCLGHLLTEKRLQRAADLLVHSDMRVKEIASSVGYVHAPSFIRAFVRRFRESPREYRNRKGANY